MKLRTLPLLCSLILAAAAPAARATLIGDTINVTQYFPNLSSPVGVVGLGNTTVVAGTGDVLTFAGYYSVNPEATTINVNFLGNLLFLATPFNGMVVSGIDDTITGVSVATNLVGWNNSQLTFDAHSVYANWAGLNITTSSYFNISVNPTPDGGHSAILLGCALLGLVAWRRVGMA